MHPHRIDPQRRRWLTAAAAALAASAGSQRVGAQVQAEPAPGIRLLPPGARSQPLPFRSVDRRMLVTVQVNGRGPFEVVFDTGGANILDLALARDLGLPLADRFEMPGAGAATLPAWRTRVREMRLGSEAGGWVAEQREQAFVALPLDAIRDAIGFERLDGIVGRELLARFVVDIDHGARRLTLHEPATLTPPPIGGATALTLAAAGPLPRVDGRIDGRAATLALDTGDRSSLTLFTPFVDEHRLREAYPRRLRTLTGWGVGGPIVADLARLPRLELGEPGAALAVQQVLARLPVGDAGVFSGRLASASAGNGVLERFWSRWNVPAGRLLLAPREPPLPPDAADASGMWLVRREGAVQVHHVDEGGPAAAAGLKPGDRIARLAGVPVSRIGLPMLRDALTAAPGDTPREPARELMLEDGRLVTIQLRARV